MNSSNSPVGFEPASALASQGGPDGAPLVDELRAVVAGRSVVRRPPLPSRREARERLDQFGQLAELERHALPFDGPGLPVGPDRPHLTADERVAVVFLGRDAKLLALRTVETGDALALLLRGRWPIG